MGGLDADGRLADDLTRGADAASAAFAELGRFIGDELAPLGREREAVGRDEYALCSRYFLGATVDLEETYAWGWEELKRLDDEMVQHRRPHPAGQHGPRGGHRARLRPRPPRAGPRDVP